MLPDIYTYSYHLIIEEQTLPYFTFHETKHIHNLQITFFFSKEYGEVHGIHIFCEKITFLIKIISFRSFDPFIHHLFYNP
jgi:hypothetical protein